MAKESDPNKGVKMSAVNATKQQKSQKPQQITTNQAVILADVGQSVVFNLLHHSSCSSSATSSSSSSTSSTSAVHPLLFPVAGVPLVDHMLFFLKDYNKFCEKRYAETMKLSAELMQQEVAFPQQISDLFICTKSKKLKNHIENWERKNIDPTTDRIAFRVFVPPNTGGESGAVKSLSDGKQALVGDLLGFLRDLQSRNIIQKDFLLWEPFALLSSPEILFEFFTQHQQTRQDKLRHCAVSKLYTELTSTEQAEQFPLTHRGFPIYLEKIEQTAYSNTLELLHCHTEKPQLDVILQDLMKREQRGCLEILKNVCDLAIMILTPDILTKVAAEAVDMTVLSDLVQNMLVEKFDSKLSSDSVYVHVCYKPVRPICFPKSIVALSKELTQKLAGPLKKQQKKAGKKDAGGGPALEPVAEGGSSAPAATQLHPFAALARPEWFSGTALVSGSEQLKLQPIEINSACITSGEEAMQIPTATSDSELELKNNTFFGPTSIKADSCVISDCYLLNNVEIEAECFLEKSIICEDSKIRSGASLNSGCFVGPSTEIPAATELLPGSVALASPSAFAGLANKETAAATGISTDTSTTTAAVFDSEKYKISHLIANELGSLAPPQPAAAASKAAAAVTESQDAEEDNDHAEIFDPQQWWSEYHGLRKFFDEEVEKNDDENGNGGNEDPFQKELRMLLTDFLQKFPCSGEQENAEDSSPDGDDYNATLLELKSLRMAARASVPEFALKILQILLQLLKQQLFSTPAASANQNVKLAVAVINRMSPFLANFTAKLDSSAKLKLVQEMHGQLCCGLQVGVGAPQNDIGSSASEHQANPNDVAELATSGGASGLQATVSPTLFVHILNAFRQFGDGDQVIDRVSIAGWYSEAHNVLEKQKTVLENQSLKNLIAFCEADSSDEESGSDGEESD
ncbi:unnamed protein product [Amoebophrya sp. A120]|nr:unnamed protein product [Amoebophrya sp. A120]|eukprot:GSA120T00008211001.1